MSATPRPEKEVLRNYYTDSLKRLITRIETFEKHDTEYKQLDSTLANLTDKTRHDIMVPVGKVAFIPGYIQHTNDVKVLLGANYFADRSVKQAREIIDRRRLYIKESLHKTQQEMDKFKASISSRSNLLGDEDEKQYNSDGEEVVEIKEEYISDEDEFETNASPSASTNSSAAASGSQGDEESAPSDEDDFDALWNHLGQIAEDPSNVPDSANSFTQGVVSGGWNKLEKGPVDEGTDHSWLDALQAEEEKALSEGKDVMDIDEHAKRTSDQIFQKLKAADSTPASKEIENSSSDSDDEEGEHEDTEEFQDVLKPHQISSPRDIHLFMKTAKARQNASELKSCLKVEKLPTDFSASSRKQRRVSFNNNIQQRVFIDDRSPPMRPQAIIPAMPPPLFDVEAATSAAKTCSQPDNQSSQSPGPPSSHGTAAFSGTIVERSATIESKSTQPSSAVQPERKSRFKAEHSNSNGREQATEQIRQLQIARQAIAEGPGLLPTTQNETPSIQPKKLSRFKASRMTKPH
mmetsp:Transcript_25654/g.50534  ORF Transcript_25654/g.50534 Transcript_25654/m.50534 type:complete len:520 (-) Transcript_25654:261-1820(-)|eukprot:CAMPEP_0175128758 /NCGR_PEP_ID=MMETSP0087-20121206/5104_1 /TAXON_ID=136419 /ORGANISM="Unknown Unknown, Strain D1" /LENGTH=519 /DNA_ID=CAMNT_0016410851 /DNA_START=24 /DNA_END=1583 /DNA_ORIENTATION=-